MSELVKGTMFDVQPSKTSARQKRHKCVFGTEEWAEHTLNFIDGCSHDCKYCYSKEMAIRFGRKKPYNWKNEVVRKNSFQKQHKKYGGTIMFPSSHDIHPEHLDETVQFLGKILKAGNRVLVVSKPHLLCIETICKNFSDFKRNILFRFTIGSSSSDILKFWEPGAPDFSERLASLKLAYGKGFDTSVSCEPMLDDEVEDVIEKVTPYITDSIWIGKANYLTRRLRINGIRDKKSIERSKELIKLQSDRNIRRLYKRLKNNEIIKWKESIKKIVGIPIPTETGLDI